MSNTDKEKTAATIREEEIQKFWQENGIFKKTENKGESHFVFYDGPPFANGEPHYGHMLASTIKDAIPRYHVMQGKNLNRRWGWDCHGLPVENLTEKELGLKGKKDIEEYGIEKFNEATRVNIMRDASVWEKQIPRLGRFVDMQNDYKTMDASYTESVWWAFKQLYDKDLIYKGFKSMHLCPRCGTTLSNFEVNLGYTDIVDLAITIPFQSVDDKNVYYLAWTTTPWTLPGNMALAVKNDIDYVEVVIEDADHAGKKYILAKDRLEAVLKDKKYKTEKFYKGSELVGKKYKPPFAYYEDLDFPNKDNAWKIYAAEYVTTTDGTGIVHIAPAFGDDDLKLAQEKNIPIVHHVSLDGKFKKEVNDFANLSVKPKDDKEKGIDHTDTDVEIIKFLAHKGQLFAKEKITHSYPLCWRCDTPLLNYASDSWFVKVTSFKEKLVEENKKVHWVPESVGQYRFGNWLSEARDWAISRSRFWGAPIPVWESKDGKDRLVLGSIDDWKKHVKKSGNTYFVVRHGQAQSNTENKVSSNYRDKVHLTESGKEQVVEAASKLKDEKIDYIFASDFLRTKETAELLALELSISKDNVIFDKRIEEINTGDFSGKPNDEYHAYFNNLEEKFTKRPPNGENLNDLKRRVMEFLYEIEEKYKNKKIVIVTHEYAVWMMFTGVLGWTTKESANDKSKKDDFIKTGEVIKLPFVPLPHNRNFELDFHRPYIDEVEIVGDSGEAMVRVKEVFDCWFESGSMPYAQDHYPFNKESFDAEGELGYPADFIAEGIDQTRGWFYSLLVLGVALFGRAPYKNVIVNGLVLAEDGQKMSKRLKNYPDPMAIIEKYGADALRYYLLSSPIVRGEELRFSEKGVSDVSNKIINRLLNTLSFLGMYANPLKTITYSDLKKQVEGSNNLLDSWIMNRLSKVQQEVTSHMEQYELDKAVRPIGVLIDDLSTWYLRRSRDRFKDEKEAERSLASATTRYVLLNISKMIAPFMPYVAEYVYGALKTSDSLLSVHMETWEKGGVVNNEVIDLMEKVRRVVSLGLEVRSKANIKVRQPLKEIRIKNFELSDKEKFLDLIKDELNIKEVIFSENGQSEVELDLNITPELQAEGEIREIIRAIQDKRKEMQLQPHDPVEVTIHAQNLLADINANRTLIMRAVNASALSVGSGELGSHDVDFEISVSKAS